MDIDWNLRNRILTSAKVKFGTWSKEDIIKHSEFLSDQIKSIELEERRLAKVRRKFLDEQDEISALLCNRRDSI